MINFHVSVRLFHILFAMFTLINLNMKATSRMLERFTVINMNMFLNHECLVYKKINVQYVLGDSV